MKKAILEILLGILIPVLFFFGSMFLLYAPGNSGFLYIAPFLLLLGITIWLHRKFKSKISKTILWLISVCAMFLFFVFFLEGIERIFSGKPDTRIVYKERNQDLYRIEIMRTDTLTLYEKFVKLNLTQSNNFHIFAFQVKSVEDIKIENAIKSLYLDNMIMKIYPAYPTLKTDDSVIFQLQNGSSISLKPYQEDEDNYRKLMGFLPQKDFFVYAEGSTECVIRYYTVNLKTGNILSGIPLFPNNIKKYYAYVNFQDILGDLYFKITLWEKDGSDLTVIYSEEILLEYSYRDKEFMFELSGMKWLETNTFTFNLSHQKDQTETINLKIKIVDL